MRAGELLGGRYRLEDRVDAGGMGTVWRGSDTRLHRTVAIKVLHAGLSNDEVFRRRFEVEARAVAALQAPGIVNIFDYGEDRGPDGALCYLIMEFVEGRSLASILAQHGRIEPGELMKILADTAEAIDAAHRSGIIHRDVKPGNILITRREGKPKIVDFGIARAHGEAGLTSTGMIMGTAAYASPEQLNGHELTGSSDIYSLGVAAYECLSGRKPFNGDTPAAIIAGHIGHQPPPLPPEIPPAIAQLITRTLAKDPAQRWPSAAAFAQACREAGAGRAPAGATAVMAQPAPMAATSVMSPPPSSPPRGVARPTARQTRPNTQPHRAPEPEESGKSKLAPIAIIAAIVVLAMVGLLIWQPWLPGDGVSADDGQTDRTEDAGEETTQDSEPDDEATDDQRPSPEPDDSNGQEPPSEQPATGIVPDVIGEEYDDAQDELQDAGFTNIEHQATGAGHYQCSVVQQNPPGNTEHQLDALITITVEWVPNEDDCDA